MGKKKFEKNETFAILIQTLHIFEAAIPCRIFIKHEKRRSSKLSKLVDNLSRLSSTTEMDLKMIKKSKTMFNRWTVTGMDKKSNK